MLKSIEPQQEITSAVDGYADGRNGRPCAQKLNPDYVEAWLAGAGDRVKSLQFQVEECANGICPLSEREKALL